MATDADVITFLGSPDRSGTTWTMLLHRYTRFHDICKPERKGVGARHVQHPDNKNYPTRSRFLRSSGIHCKQVRLLILIPISLHCGKQRLTNTPVMARFPWLSILLCPRRSQVLARYGQLPTLSCSVMCSAVRTFSTRQQPNLPRIPMVTTRMPMGPANRKSLLLSPATEHSIPPQCVKAGQ